MKSFINITLCVILLLVGREEMYSQLFFPLNSRGDISFTIDYTCLRGTGDSTMTHFKIALFTDDFNSREEAEGQLINAGINVFISKDDNLITQDSWTVESLFNNSGSALPKIIVEEFQESLLPGRYNLKFEVSDKFGSSKGLVEKVIQIADYSSDQLLISDIMLYSTEESNDGKTGYFHNVARRYGIMDPLLYLYFEVYNLDEYIGKSLNLGYSILSIHDEVQKKFPPGERSIEKSTEKFSNGFNVVSLQSGIYKLSVALINEPDTLITGTTLIEILQMPDTDVETESNSDKVLQISKNIISYLVTPTEYKKYKAANEEGKRRFIIDYWDNNNTAPNSSMNYHLVEILKRYNYSVDNFSWGKTEGWKTDRGRVLIIYGMADDIHFYKSEPGTVPYMVWEYRREKNYVFIFADLTNDGRYSQIHSTHDREVNNPYWKESLKKL